MDLRKKIVNLNGGLNIYSQLLKDEETILFLKSPALHLTSNRLGRAMRALGFEPMRSHG
ncbi:MAG: hypothetical protein IK075_00150 [Prevotella sp.]|nr:hypothetical protein [Prevotella sp.]